VKVDAAAIGANAAKMKLAELVADSGLGAFGGGGEEAEGFDGATVADQRSDPPEIDRAGAGTLS
jgi:hypothetical protein